jgi:hypothetical protein
MNKKYMTERKLFCFLFHNVLLITLTMNKKEHKIRIKKKNKRKEIFSVHHNVFLITHVKETKNKLKHKINERKQKQNKTK